MSLRPGIVGFTMIAITVVLSVMLLWTAPSLASSKKDKPKTFTGKIVALDMASKSLIISGKTGDKSFSAEKRLLKGIKIGDKVKVTYTEKKGGQGVIKKIDPQRPKSDKKTGAKKSAMLHDLDPSFCPPVRS